MAIGTVAAEPPEEILPLSVSVESLDYYRHQATLWKAVLEESPTDADAWFNYYKAARNANVLAGQKELPVAEIAAQMQEAVAGTFEASYVGFWESPLTERRYDLLLEAHRQGPDRVEAWHDLITYYELRGETALKREFCEKWYRSNAISTGILNWNYNALMSVAPDAVLLTQGDNDTYPAWVLQEVLGVQPEVKVLNLYLLIADAAYRQRMFLELGIPKQPAMPVKEDLQGHMQRVARHLVDHLERPVYFGIAVGRQLRSMEEERLYLTGLAFHRSLQPMDNVALIRNNVERKFRLDDLESPLGYDRSASVVKNMNINYIPPFILLYRHYSDSGDSFKAEKLKDLVLRIAQRSGKQEEVAIYFAEEEPERQFESLMDLRSVDKALVKIPGNRYASAYEVSNELYEQFLMDLVRQKEYDKLETCKIHPTDWLSLLPEEYRNEPDNVLYEAGHPEGPQAPVVNISFAAAETFCEWLTKAYNSAEFKRKKFKKVRFYIPDEADWMAAARGGKTGPYPWGGPYAKNLKGCYLLNVNPYLSEYDEEKEIFIRGENYELPGEDGAYFLTHVNAYFPNDFGLYNMSGNVAEMVREKTFTKGGSWLDAVHYSSIGTRHHRELPSPAVGFRYFMEVIEE